jgi:hydroxyquinol 1,2-dioxygenase
MQPHEKGFFTEQNSVEVVTGRNANAKNARLKEAMEVITRKLHEAVKEIEPTQEEWLQAILFLTRTGQICNEWRQEFILLSDILGVSMLVDAINNRKSSGASESTVLGPFHVADAPELPMGANICLDQRGKDMVIHGRILNTDGRPIERRRARRLASERRGLLRCPAKGHPAGLQLARRLPHRSRRALLVPCGQAEILSHSR